MRKGNIHQINIVFRDNRKLKIETSVSIMMKFKEQLLDDNKLFVEAGPYQFNKAEIKFVFYDN